MNRRRQQFISHLASDLTPVARPGQIGQQALAWWLVSAAFIIAATSLNSPFRGGWAHQLLVSPRFLLESLTGVAALGLATVSMFRLGIPGLPRGGLLTVVTLALAALWIGFSVLGLQAPALEPSMLGKREYCYLEVITLSVPPVLLAAWSLRRLVVLNPVTLGAVIALCSSGIVAWTMQFACMYIPSHALSHHFAPMLLSMPMGVAIYWFFHKTR